jgi:DNA-binding HxlR family transcriptional regulator
MENQFDNDSNKLSEIITLLSQLVSNNELFNQKQDTVKRLQVSSQNKLNQVNERLNSINQVSERLNSLREYNIRSAVNIRDNFELVDEKITNLGLELKKILDEVQALKATSSDSTLDKVDKKISKFTLYLNELSTNVNDIKNLEQNEFGALKKEFSQIKQSIQNNSNVIDDSPIFQNKDMSYIRVSPLSIHYNNFFLEPNLVFSKESCLVGISTGIEQERRVSFFIKFGAY